MRNGAPFTGMPDAFRQVQACLLKRPGGDREMVEILSLVLQHGEQAVLCAAEPALEESVPTRTRILNPLHRPIDGKPTCITAIDAPQALEPRRKPKADPARYDALRGKEGSPAS